MDCKLQYHFETDSESMGVERVIEQRYTVDRGIDSSRSATFIVEGHPDSFIDLGKCFIETKFRVVKENGDELDEKDNVFPTEKYGNNMWAQANVSLNNTPLPPGNDYSYTANLIDMLGSSQDSRNYVMGVLAGNNDVYVDSSHVKHAYDAYYGDERLSCSKSRTVTIIDRVHSDFLMSCCQLLPNGMQLGLTLIRNKDSFVLASMGDSTKNNYKIEIESVSLIVRRVIFNSKAHSMIARSLASGGRLNYQKLQTVVYPCAKGSRSWTWHNCFGNLVPKQAFVMIVSQEAYFGSFARNSAFFESAGVSRVRFCVDGRDVMASPYTMEFKYDVETGKVITWRDVAGSQNVLENLKKDAKDYAEMKKKHETIKKMGGSDAIVPFAGLCRVIGTSTNPRQFLGVNYSQFVSGSTVFAVSMGHNGGHEATPGSFDVHIEFGAQTTEPYMVIVTGEFHKVIGFDANRNIVEM